MRLAVIDDNPDIGEMLQKYLELAGHTVVVYSRACLQTYNQSRMEAMNTIAK